jgi:two-component system NtrC family sensor kinase
VVASHKHMGARPPCILIVDDDNDFVVMASQLLGYAGYRTLMATSGDAALDLLHQLSTDAQGDGVDLVLLDVMLPDISGVEVCHRLRQDPALRHIPIILVTALASTDQVITGLDTGADDYITKPFEPPVLLARIRAQLRLRSMERELEQRNRDLAALNAITAAVTASLELDEILTATMQGIRSVLDVEGGILLLLDEERGTLMFKQAFNHSQDWIVERGVECSQGLIAACLRERASLVVNDVSGDPRFDPEQDTLGEGSRDTAGRTPTRSLACAPLLVKGRPLGAIALVNKIGGPFTRRDVHLLESIVASVAVAIENSRLFHNLTAAYADLETHRWQLLQSHNTLQALFDGITDGLYIVDATLNLVAVNQARATRVNAQPEALIGRPCYQVLHRREGPCPGCLVGEVFRQPPGRKPQPRQRLHRQYGPDGELTEWEMSVYPISDVTQRPVQAIVLERDVTETRRLEASLAQSEKLAAIGQLAAGVAHEINNPLTAIIANAQLLRREIPADDPRYESVDLIVRASERAHKVIRGLLDFARQERLEFQLVDINASLSTSLELVQHQFRQHNIALDAQLTPGLPQVYASQDHLQGVWLNLLLNARDALMGRANPRVRVQTGWENSHITVTISDNGPGIPPAQLKRVLEPFFTTKAPGQGTGLGLSTCYRIIKQHGGDLRIESQVEQGTTVVVTLPVAE